MAVLKRGLVQIYTGPGKGKTTAAFGLAWRMLGVGGRVYICQFLKPADRPTGEATLAGRLGEDLKLDQLAVSWDMYRADSDEQQAARMAEAIEAKLAEIRPMVQGGGYDLVILDEIVFCVSKGLAQPGDVYGIIDSRAEHTELVLTGRGASEELTARADLVTQMQLVKHPYEKGVAARRGIEF